jgi:hypothetical protein
LPDKREAQAESPPIGQDIKENALSPVLSQVLVPVQNLWYIITWTREKMIISTSAKT